MAYTPEELKEKLHDLYPEIKQFGLSLNIIFDKQKDAWIVTFEKEGHQRHAFLDRNDADACMAGTSCIYLGVLIGQYIKDLEKEMSVG